MSTRIVCRACLFIIVLSVVSSVFAGEARIPIWEPTTITEPGKYIVTQDIQGTGGVTCVIINSNFVDLDLNGHHLNNANMNQPVIEIGADVSRVRIHNGFLINGSSAVQLNGFGRWIVLENLIVTAIRHAFWSVTDECVSCRIVNNTLHTALNDTIRIDAGSGIDISNNVITVGESGGAISLGTNATMSGVRIVGNTITAKQQCVDLATNGAHIQDNKIYDCGGNGITVLNGNGNFIHNNTISGCSGDGILVQTSFNQLQLNTLVENSRGLVFSAASSDNVYRSNTARGNSVLDFQDNAPPLSNTSHMDNYLPTQQ